MLVNCPKVDEIWLEFAIFIANCFDKELFVVNLTEIILNRIHAKELHIVNLYCLILKQYIFRTKCLGEPLQFRGFLNELKHVYMAEQYLAKKAKKLTYHRQKWTFGAYCNNN